MEIGSCAQRMSLLADNALNAGPMLQLKERVGILLNFLADGGRTLRGNEKLVDLGDVAVRVRGERDEQITHGATDTQFWQVETLALKAFLPHRYQ